MPQRSARKSKRLQSKRKKGFSWKLFKINQRFKKRIIKLFITLLLFVISTIFIGSLVVYKNLTVPFASAASTRAYDLDNENVYTLALSSPDNTKLMFIDKKSKKAVVYNINGNITVDVPGKLGEEKISKITALGLFLEQDNTSLFLRSIKKLVGYNIDRYIFSDVNLNDLFWNQNFFTIMKLTRNVKTNLSVSELYRIHRFLDSLPNDRIITIDFTSDRNNFDDQTREIAYDSNMFSEEKSIAILNGTGTEGLAMQGSRAVENMGGRVLAVNNSLKTYNESYIVADSYDSDTVKQLSRYFEIQNVLLKKVAVEVGIAEDAINMADVIVILGFDTALNM